MDWTTDVPTRDGWYRWRSGPASINVYAIYLDKGFYGIGNLRVVAEGLHGEWMGPMPNPILNGPLLDVGYYHESMVAWPDDGVAPGVSANGKATAPATTVPNEECLVTRLLAERDRAIAERDKLAAFKAYVHDRLDKAGVPVDPDSAHKAEGCRIGGRLDIVLGERDRLRHLEASADILRRQVGRTTPVIVAGADWFLNRKGRGGVLDPLEARLYLTLRDYFSGTPGRDILGELNAVRKERDDFRKQRLYYQDIVYAVCSALDRIDGNSVRRGEGIVCGTVDGPTTQVQDRMNRLVSEVNELRASQHGCVLQDTPDTDPTDDSKVSAAVSNLSRFINGSTPGRYAIIGIGARDKVGRPTIVVYTKARSPPPVHTGRV